MQRFDSYGWIIMSKRHSYTDGHTNHSRIFMDGLIIVVKKPFLCVARKLFAMICVLYPNCLGGGMQILPTGTGYIHGYENYQAMCVCNNDYHNNTECITIDGFHPHYQRLKVKFGNQPMQRVYKHLNEIDGMYDVVETNESQSVGKYFIIVDKNKQREAKLVVPKICKR